MTHLGHQLPAPKRGSPVRSGQCLWQPAWAGQTTASTLTTVFPSVRRVFLAVLRVA